MKSVITLIVLAVFSVASAAAFAENGQTGNLGYNSYEGYVSGGTGLNKNFGPGVGYPTDGGDYGRRYIHPQEWGKYSYGTGHLGEGYGPYIFSPREGSSAPGMFDPLPGAYREAPPPSIKVKRGCIRVKLPSDIPGIARVTVTIVAFNNAELASKCLECPPYDFAFPVMDGCKNVRVRIDYINEGLSATSYPL